MTATTELDPYRLPRSARPRRYDVTLYPDLAAGTFSGTVHIEIEIDTSEIEGVESDAVDEIDTSEIEIDTSEIESDAVDELVLNAIELDIHRCTIDFQEATFRLEEETERLFVRPAGPLGPGSHTVTVWFDGILNDKLRGFYRSTYRDDEGVERVIATTQMQATDCRRAFPCWDEPDFKAVFGVTLVVDPGLVAISNSPEIRREEARTTDGVEKVAITFGDTMAMSSYLVAFVVGPLEITETVDVDGIPLRIVHVPGKAHLTGFGLDVGAFCLRWFQDYYGIPYPGDKVDMIALPDFAAGAMENLGCITFRENLLLVDPDTATQNERQLVADVVAHELAHMWFGDLVTMRWWNGIWLNEAFATFMELAACDAYRPDWGRWTSFGLERSVALETDSLSTTRPVEYEVLSPADCEGMFDVLTYQKGGALLRMLEQHLGVERFREGVNHYLRTHAYGNTETSDLWDAIEATSGAPVRRLMDSWIWQPGYPLVHAELEEGDEDGGDGAQLVLSQRRFTFTPDASDDTVWVVPVAVRQGDRVEQLLLEGDPVRVPLADPAAPVVVNSGGHGVFRVAYDEALRSRLSGPALAGLDTLERYNLVDDAWNAMVAGRLSAMELLGFVEGFADEREHAVWQSIVIALRGLARLVEGDAHTALRARVAALVGPVVAELGDPVADEDDLIGKLRGLLTGTLAVLGGDTITQQRCREMFDAAATDPAAVHPELVATATSVLAATGDADDYERLLAGFRSARTPQEQLRHLYALAEPSDAHLLLRTCHLAMSEEVKTQNAPFLLRACMANRWNGATAWAFIRDHWDTANERFPSNTIVRMIESVKLLDRTELVDEVQAFFGQHPIRQAMKTMEQILERQRVNAAMRARESAPFAAALLAG